MSTNLNPGRVAGLWYLLLVALGPIRLIYIPSKLFADNPSETVSNIAAHEWLFRLGMASELACGVVLILLVMAVYELFNKVDQRLAVLVVILGGVMPALINFVNVVSDAGALMAARNVDFLSAFDKPQRDALAMLFLRLHGQQYAAAELLWGVWLFPLAVLAYRSGFLPRFLGVWLFIGGCAYVVMSFAALLLPQYQHQVFLISQPALFGEIALMLWLLIKGAETPLANVTESLRFGLIAMRDYPGW
jgi:hypothetical protein